MYEYSKKVRGSYTWLSFHLPLRKISHAVRVMIDSDIMIAINTPFTPNPVLLASIAASGISIIQKQKKLIQVGVTEVVATLSSAF